MENSTVQKTALPSFGRFVGFAVLSAMTCLWATAPLASGGYSGGGGGSFSGSVSRPAENDPTYDLGKAVYSGRSRSARGLRVCLLERSDEGNTEARIELDVDKPETTRLSRRSLKPYKKGSVAELVGQLVDCQDGNSLAAERLDSTETRALVYYLNKRFRLGLDA